MQKFYSPGKLLISGEYVVLDGATALALPTRFGQHMQVQEIKEPILKWRSLDHANQPWLEVSFSVSDLLKQPEPKENLPESKEAMLLNVLQTAAFLNPEVLKMAAGYQVTTSLEFPNNWGLGSSSTLIANIAAWFALDPYLLLERTFGGSGYDIAVAQKATPLTFQKQGNHRNILLTGFSPAFAEDLFFVHLNRKQNSRESIKTYREQTKLSLQTAIDKITSITHEMIACEQLQQFELLMEIHENIISQLVGLPKVKSELFPDYSGAIKSLGGWGGDFILATGGDAQRQYFKDKGYPTILSFSEMISS